MPMEMETTDSIKLLLLESGLRASPERGSATCHTEEFKEQMDKNEEENPVA